MKRKTTRPLSWLALLLVLSAAALAAENKPKPYALIFGTVWGPDNRPASGVKVKIGRASEKKSKWELVSDRRGEFAQRVPPGPLDYRVWAEPVRLKGGGK